MSELEANERTRIVEVLAAPDDLLELAYRNLGANCDLFENTPTRPLLELRSERLHLRELTFADRDELNAQFADLEHRRFELRINKQPHSADWCILASESNCRVAGGQTWFLAMRAIEDARWIGFLTLQKCHHHVGVLGFGVSKSEAGQGFAAEGSRALIQWAQAELKIRVIRCDFFAANLAARKTAEALGMAINRARWWTRLWYYWRSGERDAMHRAKMHLRNNKRFNPW